MDLKNYYKLKITFFNTNFIILMFVVMISNNFYTMEVFGEIVYDVINSDISESLTPVYLLP
jgi:hypothetical protein